MSEQEVPPVSIYGFMYDDVNVFDDNKSISREGFKPQPEAVRVSDNLNCDPNPQASTSGHPKKAGANHANRQ